MDLVGKTLSTYRIDCLLGEGGMGAVYQAHDMSLQRDVAIKVIHENIARRSNVRQRFLQEARVMAQLDHPGIVKVFTVSTMGDLLYIVMEFIPGNNLQQLLEELKKKGKWLPLHEAVHMVEQLCHTLEYAHQHKVLHRDIKPANLMLKREPTNGLPFRVILTDLGLAKLLEGQAITQEKATFGTPAYMSPEQASGRDTDAHSDVYSLGVLLYELAAGRTPFPIRTITEAIRYHTQEAPPKPRSFRPDLPESLERVILKTLEKEPSNRYASAAALGTILAGISSTSAEISKPVGDQGNSLITVYDKSVAPVPAAKPRATGPKTVFADDMVRPRGNSVFGNKSVPPSPQTRIQVVYKSNTAQIFPLPGSVIIGRGSQNDIPLTDPKASQRHAQVTWDGLEYYVTDLNSTNGTFLGNTKLLPGIPEVWQANQNIRIGDTWLRIIRPATSFQDGSGMRSRLGASALFKSPGVGFVGVIVTPQQLKVEPGASVSGTISLLNQSPNVDHFTLSMTGISSSWIASLPSGVQLMPGEQKDVVFTLKVPRATQSKAGQLSVTLRVVSQLDPSQFVEARLVLTVAVYSQFSIELQPQRFRIGQRGRLIIANQGNANQVFTAELQDNEDALEFRLIPREISIPEGQTGTVEIMASRRQQVLFGNNKIYPITAHVTTTNAEPQTRTGEVVSHAWLPKWILLIIPFLCLLLGLPGLSGLINASRAHQTETVTAQLAATAASNLTATATWLSADDDRDGLTNDQETNQYKTLPEVLDTDGDGLNDGQEVNTYKTNPLNPDTDGDGLKDGEEAAKGLNPNNTDSDGDSIPDNLDPNPAFTPTATATSTSTPTITLTPSMPAVSITPYKNDFEGRVGIEWSKNNTTTTATGRKFLGEFANDTVVLNLDNLPVHTSVQLKFDLLILHGWDGTGSPATGTGSDIWTLEVLKGPTLLTTTFCNDKRATPNGATPTSTAVPPCRQAFPGNLGTQPDYPARERAAENNSLGYDADSVYKLSYTFSHSGTSLVLIFSGSNLESSTDDSWGIDNIEVTFQ